MNKNVMTSTLALVAIALVPNIAFAAEGTDGSSQGMIALSAAIAMGLAALGGTLSQGKAISSGLEAIGRNPSASGKLLTPLILGLALIESLVIVAFVIANNLAGKL
jgi:F-type H+-transporting ATPase subunit c